MFGITDKKHTYESWSALGAPQFPLRVYDNAMDVGMIDGGGLSHLRPWVRERYWAVNQCA